MTSEHTVLYVIDVALRIRQTYSAQHIFFLPLTMYNRVRQIYLLTQVISTILCTVAPSSAHRLLVKQLSLGDFKTALIEKFTRPFKFRK